MTTNVIELFPNRGAQAAPEERSFVAFADWRMGEMLTLRKLGRIESFDAGATVIDASAVEDHSLFIVMEGELEVWRGNRRQAVLRTGNLAGELSFVDAKPRSASVRARIRSRVFRVQPEDVDRWAERDPGLALKFMREIARILSARLRSAWA